ncbi:hypothetical protein AALP_AA1G242700 [Arabis alpina]|uniref:Uncharacterized protein n=1 Tax=Arabis alpina TaxID=50452 RepID=A0A087HQB6_ARAAL|nr:hypothetical protein AALP_AA1G242700 [Arabis alpina]
MSREVLAEADRWEVLAEPVENSVDGASWMDPYPVLPEFDEIPFVVKSEGYEWPADAILTQEQEDKFLHVLHVEKKARRERQGMKYKKRGNPDPPGSTLCSAESLDKLRTEFEVPSEIEFSVPRSSDRADDPPPGYFTMYENSLEECFLTFPIPSVILDYFWRYKIALAQATPRGPSGFPPCPDGLFTDFLSAVRFERHLCFWERTFHFQRVKRAMGYLSFREEMAAQERAHAENLAAGVETNPAGGQEGGVQDQPIVSGEISEVPREKLKKSRRSKKPPRVPVSDGVIPSSEAGASASGTALEQDGESHSARLHKKRSCRIPQHFAAANRLTRKLYDRGELSRKSCSDAQTRLGIEMEHRKSVESELQAYQRRCVEAEERAVEESAKASILQRQLADEKTGITSRIKRATKAAMRTFATKIMREAPDSFDAEVARTEAWLPNVAGSDVEFDSLFAGLDFDLVISPISSDSSGTARDNVSLETLATDVGVRAFDGSMTDELGVNHDDDEYVNIVD